VTRPGWQTAAPTQIGQTLRRDHSIDLFFDRLEADHRLELTKDRVVRAILRRSRHSSRVERHVVTIALDPLAGVLFIEKLLG